VACEPQSPRNVGKSGSAGYDDSAPTLQSLSITTHGTARQPLAFSVSPLDVWSALAPTSWSFGDGSGTSGGTSVTHTYTAAGTYNVMLSSADVLGNATSTSAAVLIAPAATMISTATSTPPSVAPTIASATETNGIWREGNRLAQISKKKKPPVGTTFSFTLNEQASISFAFTQQVGGRKVNGKCFAQTKTNRHKHACKRAVTRGTLSFTGHIGANKVHFQGRISASKKLPLGHYTLIITATTSAGQRSQPESLSFTIVK
jgi:PKD repeat protein